MIETLAERIATTLLASHERVQSVRVKVSKPQVARRHRTTAAAVEIKRAFDKSAAPPPPSPGPGSHWTKQASRGKYAGRFNTCAGRERVSAGLSLTALQDVPEARAEVCPRSLCDWFRSTTCQQQQRESRAATIGASAFGTLPGQCASSRASPSCRWRHMNIAPLLPLVKSDLNLTDTGPRLTSATILTYASQRRGSEQPRRKAHGATRGYYHGRRSSRRSAPNVPLLLLTILIGVGTSLLRRRTHLHEPSSPPTGAFSARACSGQRRNLGILTVLTFSERRRWRWRAMVEGIAILIFGGTSP